jgi:dihydrofolate synthase/folylpolyglutamate synthase
VLGQTIDVQSPLTGAHQQRNVALAIAAAAELKTKHGFPVTAASIAAGIRQTNWPARLERVQRGGQQWILDVAHNPAGAWALRAGLSNLLDENHPRTLIFSCLRDKPVTEMAQILFPLFDQVIFTPIHSVRAASMDELQAAAKLTGAAAIATHSVSQALQVAKQRSVGGMIVICGSVYLVGEARSLLLAGEES